MLPFFCAKNDVFAKKCLFLNYKIIFNLVGMKKLRSYLVMMAVVCMPLFCSSCKDDDENNDVSDPISNDQNEKDRDENGDGDESDELSDDYMNPFIEYSKPQAFYETYTSYVHPKALIDVRSAELYAAGSLEGAVNMPADVYNTASDDAQWCVDLLAAYPTNTCLFFYGTTSFQMIKTVAGRASRLGYGKQNSRICTKEYGELKSIWK